MKLFWTGTDTLMLVDISKRSIRKKVIWFIFRIIIRFLDKFYIESHYIDSLNLKSRLVKFGVTKPIKVFPDKIKYKKKFPKKKHSKFNVLYYFPKKTSDIDFWKWIYGYDIYLKLKKEFKDANFILVDGFQDLEEIYPIVDFYLRPNRSDGASRMRQECEVQDIPYYWTQKDPSFNDAKQKILFYENEFKKKA